ncbi:hypothetical protein Xoosp13_89 [Xanthomonas phage Xoo-sp13]|nr:hypothetical protein Xoosp13_89 [Xanthomonas phage Xoo-sp13]
MNIQARVVSTHQGHKGDGQQILDAGLNINDIVDVDKIDMGGSYTTITLKGHKGYFNSVNFEFLENGKMLDIYQDKRFFSNDYFISSQ